MSDPVRLPDPCLVVLVGATAAGKSHRAAEAFAGDLIVSSDRLRAVVGAGERDQRASRDAFVASRAERVGGAPGPSRSTSAAFVSLPRHGVQTAIVGLSDADGPESVRPVRRRHRCVLTAARRALRRRAVSAGVRGYLPFSQPPFSSQGALPAR